MATHNTIPQHTNFHRNLLLLNDLEAAGFDEWVFLPSMVFGAAHKWWGDKGKRDAVHEGIDLCLYRDTESKVHYLGAGTKIPVTFKGTIKHIINDFLGRSIFLLHDEYRHKASRLYTIYGHTEPSPAIEPGTMIGPEEVIGTIADPKNRSTSIRPHLHISLAWIPDSLDLEDYSWDTLGNPKLIRLIDPIPVLELPFSVISSL